MSFTIYQASAGSGKTFSLAKEYLKIGLSHPDAFKSILAITFTNKAAAEMKNRILSYLTDIDGGDRNSKGYLEMLPKIIEELNISEEKAVENASILLKKIIYNYADFSVMTIDSFFQRILRTFAYDLDIPSNFQLEIDQSEIIEQVVALLIDQVGENEDLTKMMLEFVHSSADDSKSWHIEKEIASFTPELFKEQSALFIDRLSHLSLSQFSQIIQNFNAEKNQLRNKLASDVQSIKLLLINQNIELDAFSNNCLGKWITSIEKETYSIGKILKKSIEEDSWFPKKNQAKYMLSFQSIEIQFKELLNNTFKISKRILFISTIQKKIFPMALLNELKIMLSHIDSIEHTFHISNTNTKLHEITSNEPAPFIYERLGEKYAYYFIDEFQDTSRLQWLNVLPLICEALSAYHGVDEGKAILFGDPKQAIYRFRGGDVDQFISLPSIPNPHENQLVSLMEKTISQNFNTVNLDTNFRSFENIVTFNNEFFQYLVDANPSLLELYKHLKQKFLPSKNGGLVSITSYIKQESLSFNDFALTEMLSHIQSAIKDGFRYKDIAILTRDRTHAPEIADFLSNQGISVISSESLLLTASVKVLFVLNILQFNAQPSNQVLAFSIYVKFFQLFKPDSPIDVNPTSISLSELESLFAEHDYVFNLRKLNALNLYEKAESIIRAFHLEFPADIYLLTFLNILNERTIISPQEHKFWDWWENNKTTISVEMPDEVNGITLLTIHKSKGLEFPIVIFPNYGTNGKRDDLWIALSGDASDKDQVLPVAKIKLIETEENDFSSDITNELTRILIDQVNVLYVALTRAVERLHIVINTPPKSPSSFSFLKSLYDFAISNSLFECITTEKSTSFVYGIPSAKNIVEKMNLENSVSIQKLFSIDWKENHWMSEQYENSEAQNMGNLFHFTMANIQTFSDFDVAIDNTRKIFKLNTDITLKIKKMVFLVLNHAALIPLFESTNSVLNETEMINSKGEILRPDRVVVAKEMATVLDYKTGSPSQHHIEQLEKYKALLLELNYSSVFGLIVYINEQSVIVVPV